MSSPDWPPPSDDALDSLLAKLGTPEAARPDASPAEILGRAALLAPPIVGLTGWKLAATLALAVGGGFLAGLWMRGGGEEAPRPGLPEPTARAPEPVRELPPAPSLTAEPEPQIASTSRPRARIARVGATLSAPSEPAVAPSPASGLPSSAACPTNELGDEDVAAIADLLPKQEAPEPAPEPEALDAPEDLVAEREEEQTDPKARGEHPLEGRVRVGAVVLPGNASGLVASLGVERGPAVDAKKGGILAADLDVGLIAATPSARWTSALALEAGRAWRFGRTELDAGWTLGARVVLPAPARKEDAEAEAPTGVLANKGLGLFPVTGPTLGLAFGEPGSSRLRVDLSAQVGPGAPGEAPQTWASLSVGSSFAFFSKKNT